MRGCRVCLIYDETVILLYWHKEEASMYAKKVDAKGYDVDQIKMLQKYIE